MADYKIADGINLHVIKETKFKTIRIMVRFRENISSEHLGKRVLISNMLETTNAVYPTGQAFSSKLSSLFGASFTTGVAKKGKQHLLTITMNIVNPKFVDFDTLGEAVKFLKTALFSPDVVGQAFNPEIFKREQINLVHYLQSMNDDRSYYASRKLSQLFFSDKNQALPSVGTVELIQKETATSVFAYYQEMLKTNEVDIFVLGDVDEKRIFELFSDFKFTGEEQADSDVISSPSLRSPSAKALKPFGRFVSKDLFYSQALLEAPLTLLEEKEAAQSLLQLGYHLGVAYGDADYLALQVMNGLLGGFSHSKLFTNVREKASLAYSISSTFDSFSGFFKISAGIDATNFEKTRALIIEQLTAVKTGDFTDELMERTKTMLRNTYFVSQDSSSNNIELAFIKALLPERFLDSEAFLTALSAVSKADVERVAQGLVLQAEYFMRGSDLSLL